VSQRLATADETPEPYKEPKSMRASILLLAALWILPSEAFAQTSARLIRNADVSDTQIAFVYGGDIWVVPKSGGTASQVTHSPGEESWPRFSPDGSEIGYTAAYDGNADVYVMPSAGGLPTRVTYQSLGDRMLDWHPDGERVLFASARASGQPRVTQFYLVSKDGGLPERLAVPYGELASFSPDGSRLAYITKITENYPFKRYRGGLASDVLVFDLEANTAENVTANRANDGKPAWVGDRIFFLSDRGSELRLNVWSYDTGTGATSQVTHFDDFDISFMTAGPSDLVFEAGGTLYLMDVAADEYTPVTIDIVSDLSAEMPRLTDVSGRIRNMTASPEGTRVAFEARGELFNVPSFEGYSLNMTQSSGAFDRDPAWSPDGGSIAYWSDRTGENEVFIESSDEGGSPRQLTNRGRGFGYKLFWSPDATKLAFIDETNDVIVVEVESGESTVAGNFGWNIGHGGRQLYPIAWSPDSRWMAFGQGTPNYSSAVVVYDAVEGAAHQVTSGFYTDSDPVFSADGRYLFYLTERDFSAAYSALGDGTWVYPNTTRIAAIALTPDAPSLLEARNDEVEVDGDDEAEDGQESENGQDPDADEVTVEIDFDGIESRLVLLPLDAGNIGDLMPFEGKLAYRRAPNTGSGGGPASLQYYDLEEREEETIMSDVSAVAMTADGESILVRSGSRYGIVRPMPDQSIEDPIPTDGLVMALVPREEWRQIFEDTWRRYRDFFYDPELHQVDWEGLRDRYRPLIDEARTRWDVSFVQSQMQSELSAGHTYTSGGDTETVRSVQTGYLGIDFELSDGRYRIARVVQPAEWDTRVRSPFDRPGVDVDIGDYLLAVNGVALDPARDPYAAFEGLAGETVSLTVSRSGEPDDTRNVVLQTLTTGQEIDLRYLEWIERNRRMVEELSEGQLGYIYMANTSAQGQEELVSMFYGQLDKRGFIIDERFNSGGQLADRFLELLQRPVVYNLHWRHGWDHTQPPRTNTGPLGMLINGWAGSGGDALPWAFQELEAGPIVGERTLGILVGPATGHQLIDGGSITVPGARLYDNDGHWFWEGEGVSPDIEVWDDPNVLVQGRDPQIERVVEEVMRALEDDPDAMTPAPPLEDRSGLGSTTR
jgi:tricorn protease